MIAHISRAWKGGRAAGAHSFFVAPGARADASPPPASHRGLDALDRGDPDSNIASRAVKCARLWAKDARTAHSVAVGAMRGPPQPRRSRSPCARQRPATRALGSPWPRRLWWDHHLGRLCGVEIGTVPKKLLGGMATHQRSRHARQAPLHRARCRSAQIIPPVMFRRARQAAD
jgi:hypothetical protein